MVDLSIVIPVYNEEKNIPILYNKLNEVIQSLKLSYEIVFADDGSKDNTIRNIEALQDKDNKVKLIQFRKNFGKSYALYEGFKNATGKIIITMDGDLQDDPNEIPRFLEAIKNYDVVVGWKFRRKDPLTKTIPSKIANYTNRKATKLSIHDMNCGFKAYKSEAAKSLKLYGDMHRYIPALLAEKGFKVGEIKITHHKRKYGKSKYGFGRLSRGLFDFMTIRFLTNYSNRPLHFFGGIGIALGTIGFLMELYALYLKVFLGELFLTHISLIIFGFILILMGLQLISIGLLGEMIVKNNNVTNYEVKRKIGF